MDINSLLSPSDTPRASSLTPSSVNHSQSAFKPVQRTRSGTPSGSAQPTLTVNSPLSRSIQPPSSIPAHVRSPSQQPSHSSPLISPVPTGTATHITGSSSTQSMDNLPDLTSLQNARSTPPVLKSRDSSDSQLSSSAGPAAPHLLSATSNPRTSFDIAMVETPKQALRLDYSDTSLQPESQQRLAVLVAYIQETPSSYDGHKEIIKILHQGFVDHIYPSSSPGARRDPRSYDLLPELRHARETLDKLFAVGEDQWLDWLQDESILAHTAEERVAVVDKCRRAVSEEYGSTSLWVNYGEWVLHCYKWAQDTSADSQGDIVDTERIVGREVFDWNLVLETWAEGILRTQLDLSHSHEVWDKYMTIRFGETGQKLSPSEAEAALDLFQSRLRVPHSTWEQTFSSFSSFVSANCPDTQYEEMMASTLRASITAKKIWSEREVLESSLETARANGDQTAEYQAFLRYIEWEIAEEDRAKKYRRPRGKRDNASALANAPDMINPLYYRAELRFPSVLTIWEDHIEYLSPKSSDRLLEVLARATKHCPWSGSLWKQYLLTSELAEDTFDETESIKHKATSTGLLDAAGTQEALVVYDAWCGYLLRRTRKPDSTEEDSDVAEMGIRSSIEAVHSLASKLGLSSDFDPSFSLQRKYVEYLKSQHRFDNARAQFDDSVTDYGKHYKFWLRFYEFELQKNVLMAISHPNSADRLAAVSSAPFAVGVLKQGLEHPGLDHPEPLIEALLNHCEDYEDADELQSAMSLVRKVQKTLTAKRHQEALEANQHELEAQQMALEVAQNAHETTNGIQNEKRKREDENDRVEDPAKRYKSDETIINTNEVSSVREEELSLKRDRENSSVWVRNVPLNTPETKIRQYFSNCGTVKHLKILQDEDNAIIVEFEDSEAAQFALSRDGRPFEGAELSIVLSTKSTLYVTNYIASADEAYIRNIMRPYGEIIGVRFPSLQKNKRRRFCYVDFKEQSQAEAATELDNREIDGLKIIVKVSDPARRHARAENDETKTLFVGHLPFKATSKDVEKIFAAYGKVEQIKVPQDPKSKSKNRGIAFVTFADSEEAHSALALDQTELLGRKITVNIAADNKPGANPSVSGRSKSPSAQPDPESKAMSASEDHNALVTNLEERHQRTVTISDVPDTVNESRIKALAEKFGPTRKVVLKTNHQGAIIEFEKVVDAGRAAIGLDGHEIDPGRYIRVTTQKEMFQQKPELKQEQFLQRPAVNRPTMKGPVKRPPQPGARKGGNLGQRSATIFQANTGSNEQNGTKKTNDDFRSLINKS
ncbi:hypothetical protein LTR84_011911 [Exophiala bonariae]|uniref:RRM domain-containing protein n=1 Tax=Exophiala bonariae TaxID=1690606 RepID=A0AAV9NHB9_9EURO|nr:hypothetical protein LTR84_011911 [Exophiala bonariae]